MEPDRQYETESHTRIPVRFAGQRFGIHGFSAGRAMNFSSETLGPRRGWRDMDGVARDGGAGIPARHEDPARLVPDRPSGPVAVAL